MAQDGMWWDCQGPDGRRPSQTVIQVRSLHGEPTGQPSAHRDGSSRPQLPLPHHPRIMVPPKPHPQERLETGMGTETTGPLWVGYKGLQSGRHLWNCGLKFNTRKRFSQRALSKTLAWLPGKREGTLCLGRYASSGRQGRCGQLC